MFSLSVGFSINVRKSKDKGMAKKYTYSNSERKHT